MVTTTIHHPTHPCPHPTTYPRTSPASSEDYSWDVSAVSAYSHTVVDRVGPAPPPSGEAMLTAGCIIVHLCPARLLFY